MKKFTVISTFSGVGGSSLGYKLAGFDVRLANEFINIAAENYRLNFPNTPVIQLDIRKLTGKRLLRLAGIHDNDELDLLDGSPPCSSFSMNGSREEYWGKEKRYSETVQRTDDLIGEQIRLIGEIRPRAIVLENVKGLTLGIAKPILTGYVNQIKELGYDVSVKLMKAQFFECATTRERMFIIGIRKDLGVKASHPNPVSTPIPIAQALADVVNTKEAVAEVRKVLMGKDGNTHFGQVASRLKTGTSANKIHPKGSWFNVRRQSMSKPLATITTKPGELIHPLESRCFTVAELSACSSFPKWFKFIGTYHQQAERIGRAVPPNLMKNIGLHVKKLLELSLKRELDTVLV